MSICNTIKPCPGSQWWFWTLCYTTVSFRIVHQVLDVLYSTPLKQIQMNFVLRGNTLNFLNVLPNCNSLFVPIMKEVSCVGYYMTVSFVMYTCRLVRIVRMVNSMGLWWTWSCDRCRQGMHAECWRRSIMEKNLLEGLRGRQRSNVRMDRREKGLEDGTWIDLDQDRVRWRAKGLSMLNFRFLESWC